MLKTYSGAMLVGTLREGLYLLSPGASPLHFAAPTDFLTVGFAMPKDWTLGSDHNTVSHSQFQPLAGE
jgi:hypothetical protein